MKNLKNLKGAKLLSKNEQQSIKGGKRLCPCPPGQVCINGVCWLELPHMEP